MSVTPYYYPEEALKVTLHYGEHMKRAGEAHRSGWYLESLTILSSLMENYTYRLLLSLHIPFKAADRMFQCLEYVRLHIKEKDLPEEKIKVLEEELIGSGLYDRISDWRIRRNLLIHDYAIRSYTREETAAISKEGILLAERFRDTVESVINA